MERYVDIFVREHPQQPGELMADYLDRFMRWMCTQQGALSPSAVSRFKRRIREEMSAAAASLRTVSLCIGNVTQRVSNGHSDS